MNHQAQGHHTDIVYIKSLGLGYLTDFNKRGQSIFGRKEDAMGVGNQAASDFCFEIDSAEHPVSITD